MTRNHMLALLVCCGLVALAWPLPMTPHLRVVYNASDSVPRGWYRIIPAHSLPVGSIVLVVLPVDVSTLAAQRGYLPGRIPLLKRVAAVAPQQVCIAQQQVTIDGVVVGTVLTVDSQGRTLPAWQQCRALREGELFLLSATHPASFDSRYFGPVHLASVLGTAHPFWIGNAL